MSKCDQFELDLDSMVGFFRATSITTRWCFSLLPNFRTSSSSRYLLKKHFLKFLGVENAAATANQKKKKVFQCSAKTLSTIFSSNFKCEKILLL
jgi:hypothetical protein